MPSGRVLEQGLAPIVLGANGVITAPDAESADAGGAASDAAVHLPSIATISASPLVEHMALALCTSALDVGL